MYAEHIWITSIASRGSVTSRCRRCASGLIPCKSDPSGCAAGSRWETSQYQWKRVAGTCGSCGSLPTGWPSPHTTTCTVAGSGAMWHECPETEWQRRSGGEGAKGPRWYDWARVRLAGLQLTAEERRWEHWLLVRRGRTDPTALAYPRALPDGAAIGREIGPGTGARQQSAAARQHRERPDGGGRGQALMMFAPALAAVMRNQDAPLLGAEIDRLPLSSLPPTWSHCALCSHVTASTVASRKSVIALSISIKQHVSGRRRQRGAHALE